MSLLSPARHFLGAMIAGLILSLAAPVASAESALAVLGRDFNFPEALPGMPRKLSDMADLQINSFTTNDGVKLAYWEAGQGQPLVFVPGWSAHGAQYINLLHLLSRHYHVYVLDLRNQGLSQKVTYGNRIARHAIDLKQFGEHLGLRSATYVEGKPGYGQF